MNFSSSTTSCSSRSACSVMARGETAVSVGVPCGSRHASSTWRGTRRTVPDPALDHGRLRLRAPDGAGQGPEHPQAWLAASLTVNLGYSRSSSITTSSQMPCRRWRGRRARALCVSHQRDPALGISFYTFESTEYTSTSIAGTSRRPARSSASRRSSRSSRTSSQGRSCARRIYSRSCATARA